MDKVKIVSFDAEGTLVTPYFTQAIWHEEIPTLYAQNNGISFEQAKAFVQQEYNLIGEQRMEWYDIKFWFGRFGLSNYRQLLHSQKHRISVYPEVEEVLFALSQTYELIVISNSSTEFLDVLLEGIRDHFTRIFSSISNYEGLKTADFYLNVCQAMGVEPEEMAHVGDLWNSDLVIPRRIGIKAFYLDRNGGRQGSEVVRDLTHFQRRLYDHSAC
jgi:putative hydrolase of the HAD superfamily